MDYGNILTRTWTIIWTHKYLIGLGLLAALGNGFGTGSPANFSGQSTDNGFQFQGPAEFGQFEPMAGLAVAVIIVIFGIVLLIGLALWAVSRIAEGGLIAGASTIDGGGASSFGQDWRTGWARAGRLIGIGLIPLIPVLILVALIAGLGLLLYGFSSVATEGASVPPGNWSVFAIGGLACLIIPVAVVLNLLRTFADRACMLEDLPVLAAYSRGWQVLTKNLGAAVILFLIQIAIGIALFVVLLVPGIIVALCCLLWPLFFVVQGIITAYFSTLWTLAWREWTGSGHGGGFGANTVPAR